MEKFVIICVTAELGFVPYFCQLEDTSKIDRRVKTIIETCYKDKAPAYAEVWRLLGDGIFTYHYSCIFDGVSFSKCRYFAPSSSSLKDHVEMFSFKSFEL